MQAVALSRDARRAQQLQAAAPLTFQLFERVIGAKASTPHFFAGEQAPLYRRLRAFEADLAVLLESGGDVPEALRWSIEAVCRRAENEAVRESA